MKMWIAAYAVCGLLTYGWLQERAADDRIYVGHGDYTEQPISGADAQAIARAALS